MKLLGHGSFSSVCLGLDTYTDEKVCLMRCPTLYKRSSALPHGLQSRLCMCWRMRTASGNSMHIICVSVSEAEVMHVALKWMPDVLSSLKQEAFVLNGFMTSDAARTAFVSAQQQHLCCRWP